MHILLVVPRYGLNCDEFYQFPLGLGYIATAMKHAGHRVSGLNLNHHHGSVEDIVASKVLELAPDVCASGSLAPFLSSLRVIYAAARRAKPDIINLAGGGMVSGEPEMSLEVMDIDYGVIGEGEETVVELLECLERRGDPREVNGIVFRDRSGNTVVTPARQTNRDLGSIAWPDYELLECDKNISIQRPLDCYFYQSNPDNNPRAVDMITSRSCPFSCTFCFHPVGKVYRERPLDDFFAELDMVVSRYRINMVALVDELFSLRKQRLLEFCERIKPYNLQWMTQLHVNSACEETLKAMRDSGCTYISYGIESMSPPVLKSMKKEATTERIASALALTLENRIGIQGNLLFGDKAETLVTANESMHWWANNRRYQINLTPLTVFPGSPDYYQAIEKGLITDRAAYVENIPGRFNITGMSDKDLEMMFFQLWVFSNTLLNIAPSKTFAPSSGLDGTYDIIWDCPHCGHENRYLGVSLSPEAGQSLRLCCRNCLVRWDIENKAYRVESSNSTQRSQQTARRLLAAFVDRIRQGKYREIASKLVELSLRTLPGRLRAGDRYRQIIPQEYILKSAGAALVANPFSPVHHNDFADALCEAGAYGAARMHYQQALELQTENERALAGVAKVDAVGADEPQQMTYFVSWDDDR